MNQKHAQCLICGATALKALPEYAKDHLVQCSSCHFVFSHLIPGTEELNEYYKNYGSGQHEAISPITIKRYHELLDQFERYRKYGTLLDVGCGSGHFLATAKERGWQVYGTEFPESLCDVCRKKGLTVHRGVLNTANYPNMQFDVLTSFEVIEHINNPLEELAKFQQLLRPGGLFYCTTPNFNSLQRYQLGPDWNVFAYPEHISYYTRSTLAEVARRSGFKPLTIQTTGFSFSRAKSKTLKREHVTGKGSPDELARQAIEGNAGLRLAKSAVNQVLSVTGTGATLKGYFKRL